MKGYWDNFIEIKRISRDYDEQLHADKWNIAYLFKKCTNSQADTTEQDLSWQKTE